jgi:hypothetical protein
MTDDKPPPEPQRETRPAPDANTLPDRRRPGRVSYVNPHLIRLLRKPAEAREIAIGSQSEHSAKPQPEEDGPDNLGAARGVLAALAIGLVFWGVAAALVWFLMLR